MRRADVRDRAIRVYNGLVRGLSVNEIADTEGLPQRTVYWLVKEGGRILDGDIKALTESGLLKHLIHHHRQRKKHLWLLHQTAKQEAVKVSALRQLIEEDRMFIDLAQRMNIIETPKSTGTNVNVGVTVNNTPREDLSDADLVSRLSSRGSHCLN